jgi:hypothetical protein
MRATVAGVAEREPQRPPVKVTAHSSRRGELLAGLATAALLAQLLFAQLILIIALILLAAGRLSRWRPQWLAVPAGAGLIWLLDTGPRRSLAGLRAGSAQAVRFLAAAATHPAQLARPDGALAGAGRWLPAQLPLALLAGSAEAAALLWLSWHRAPPDWRPGLVASARLRGAAAAVRAGRTVTRTGFALGLHPGTGTLAGLSWTQAAGGVLVTGPDPGAVAAASLTAACAALRRRKTVLILDLAPGGPPAVPGTGLAAAVATVAGQLGIAVTGPVPGPGVAAIGAAIRSRGVVLLRAGQAAAPARLISDLTGVLGNLSHLGLRADCLAVIAGCEAVQPGPLTALLTLGPGTGTVLLLSTSAEPAAAALWPYAAAAVVSGPVTEDLAVQLAGRAGPGGPASSQQAVTSLWRQQPGSIALVIKPGKTGHSASRVTAGISQVPVDAASVR